MEQLPLDGTRVVSLAINLPGPLAAARLAEYGAAVTKVEPPFGDPLALAAPGWYAVLVASQRVVTLDLKAPGDRAALEQHLGEADLLLTAMRPSALERLGLRESVRRHRLAHVEIVGHTGADAELPGHDLTYQAAHGTIDPPHLPLVPVADLIGAERAMTAAFAALRERERGELRPHPVALHDAAEAAAAPLQYGLTGPGSPLGGGLPTYAVYATADGYVAVAALEPYFAARFFAELGSSTDAIAARLRERTSDDWTTFGRAHGIPIQRVCQPQKP